MVRYAGLLPSMLDCIRVLAVSKGCVRVPAVRPDALADPTNATVSECPDSRSACRITGASPRYEAV